MERVSARRAINLIYAQSLLVFIELNAARILVSLYALDMGASTSDVGLINSMLYLFPFLLSFPVGVLGDRHGSRWLLVAGALAAALGLLAPWLWRALPALWVAAGGTGIAVAVTNVLGQNLIGVLSRPADRTRNFGNYTLLGAVANFLGPLLTGFAIDHAGFAPTSLLLSGVAVIAVLLVLVWGGALPPGSGRKTSLGNPLASLGDRTLRRVLIIGGICQVGFDSFNSFMPVYGHHFGVSASAIGTALSAFAVSSFLARIVMTRTIAQWGEKRVMIAGFVFGAAAFFALPFFEAAVALSVISFVFGLFIGLSQPITMMLTFSASAAGRAGEAMGLRLTFNNFMRVVGPSVFGAVARAFGLPVLFVASGVMLCLGGYLCRGVPVTRSRSL